MDMTMEYSERLTYATAVYNKGKERVRTTPAPEGQKYPPGARVRINRKEGVDGGRIATVLYTYAHAYQEFGHSNGTKEYALDIDGQGECAWYHESDLSLINEDAGGINE